MKNVSYRVKENIRSKAALCVGGRHVNVLVHGRVNRKLLLVGMFDVVHNACDEVLLQRVRTVG